MESRAKMSVLLPFRVSFFAYFCAIKSGCISLASLISAVYPCGKPAPTGKQSTNGCFSTSVLVYGLNPPMLEARLRKWVAPCQRMCWRSNWNSRHRCRRAESETPACHGTGTWQPTKSTKETSEPSWYLVILNDLCQHYNYKIIPLKFISY